MPVTSERPNAALSDEEQTMTKKKAARNSTRATQAPVTSHATEHGHDSHVDEASAYGATHFVENPQQYIRPSALDAPDPREGMTQRWVRCSVRGEADPRNLNQRMREGWRARHPDTLPEDWSAFAPADKTNGQIKVDDLVLMEIPTKVLAQRKAYTDEQTRRQMQGVEHDLERSQMPGHPITKEHKTSVTHPGIQVAPDE